MGKPWFSIRSLMVVVALVGILAWAARRSNAGEFVGRLWPLIPMTITLVIGWFWTAERIYRNPRDKQTLPIIALIVLVIATLSMPLWPLLFGARYDF